MNAESLMERAAELDLRLAQDAAHIDVPSDLSPDVREAILANRSEVLLALAERERDTLKARLEALWRLLDDPDLGDGDRSALAVQFQASGRRLDMVRETIRCAEDDIEARQWAREGWLLMRSSVLKAVVVVVKDAAVTVPGYLAGYPRYLFAEVRALDGHSDDAIRQTHAVKVAMSGTIANGVTP